MRVSGGRQGRHELLRGEGLVAPVREQAAQDALVLVAEVQEEGGGAAVGAGEVRVQTPRARMRRVTL